MISTFPVQTLATPLWGASGRHGGLRAGEALGWELAVHG